MRSVRTLTVCAAFLTMALAATAATTWVDYGSSNPFAAPDVRLVASGFDGAALTIDFPGLEAQEVETKGGTFTRLTIPGYHHTFDAGLPRLPVVREFLEIPHGATPRLTIVGAEYAETTLADLGFAGPIEPAQPSVEKLPGAREAARFALDRGAYAVDAFGPDVAAAVGETGQFRAHRFVEVEIFPVQYNPATGAIRYLTSIELRVDFEGADVGATNAALERYSSPDFDAFARRNFVNADAFKTRALTLPIGYLVICYDAYYEEIEQFAGLRHRLGYETTVTKTSEIPGGATTTNIQAYIKNAYETWPVPPTFVVLIGDTGQVPYFAATTGSHATDLYYVCMDAGDDWLPDMYVGRFSCDSEAEVTLLADKSTKYVRFALTSTPEDWADECTFMASSDNYGVSEGTHNYCISNWVQPAGYDVINKRYSVTYSATTQQCIDDINAGVSMLTYSGHGSTNGWADGPPMTATQVQALTNADMLPMVQSYACITGSYDSACFGETWTLAQNGGVLFLGASNNSYWDEDDYMERAVYDAWFGNDYKWVRGMFNEGLWEVYTVYSGAGRTRYYYEMYTVFGDPALDPWTSVPSQLDVTYASAFPVGGELFSVDVGTTSRDPVENALVCIYMDGELYETAYTDAAGHVDITVTTPPQTVGMMDVWVSKHDFVPHSGAVEVIVPVTYDITPSSVPVNKATDVTVTIWDDLGVEKPDVVVTIDGWGIDPLVDTTDVLGEAHFSVFAPYGEDLTVVGREIGESYNCFADVIPVTGGLVLGSPDIDASVAEIGLYGSLTPHYEGLISGTATIDGFTLYAVGCGVDETANSGMGNTAEIRATPTTTGTIEGAIARSGYDVYLEDIAVEVVYGQLAGEVYEATRAPVEGARVKGYAAGADTSSASPVFSELTDVGGAYAVEDDLDVGFYDVYVLKFGYDPHYEEVFVQYGANDADFYVDFAPSGLLSGTVTETGTGLPLEATVKIYRSDDMSLYAEVTSDTLLGGYYEVTLPYFNYLMNVRAYHHIPESRGISVTSPLTENFVLDTTLANILVIDDPAVARELYKTDKTGAVLDVWHGSSEGARSAAQLAADLVDLGYDVTEETSAATSPVSWMDYDFIVWASGDNTAPVADAGYRTALETYVANGGKLLIEGGELAYDAQSYPGYPSFCAS
ncbi:MAG: C25 family cysteine peptidase, partial [Candidatus Eisenbacteria bacterium]